MLYNLLISFLLLSSLSLGREAIINLDSYLNQNEVLEVKINQPEVNLELDKAPQKISESLGIHTTAQSAIIVDRASGEILFQKDPEKQLPIASITKLMTALVFLEHNPGFEQIGQINAGENSLAGSRLFVKNGEELKVEDLFYASLVGSTNNVTQALVHTTGLNGEAFVEVMNEKAINLGMTKTHFIEPTGLNKENVSTAKDLTKLALVAFKVTDIQKATTLKEYNLTTLTSHQFHHIKSQDDLLNSYLEITGAKTGYTEEAGYCLVTQAQNQKGKEVIVVVLGSESSSSRFQEAKALVTWAFDNFKW